MFSVGNQSGRKLKLYTAFLNIIKLSGYRKGKKFDKDPLAVKQQLHDQNCKWLHCI